MQSFQFMTRIILTELYHENMCIKRNLQHTVHYTNVHAQQQKRQVYSKIQVVVLTSIIQVFYTSVVTRAFEDKGR